MLLQEIDGASIGIILTAESKKKMDLAYYVWTEFCTLIVPRPGEQSRLLALVHPFDLTVIIIPLSKNICAMSSHKLGLLILVYFL